MTEATKKPPSTPPAQDRADIPYAHLPEPIQIADTTTTSHPASPPPDPDGNRNTELDDAPA